MSDKSLRNIHVGNVAKDIKRLESAFSPIAHRRTYKNSENSNNAGELEETPNGGLNIKVHIRKCLYDRSAQQEKENLDVSGLKDLPRSPEFPPWRASSSLNSLKSENEERLGMKRSFSEVETSPEQDGTEKKNNSQYKRAFKVSDVHVNPSTGLTMEIDALLLSDLRKDIAKTGSPEKEVVKASRTPEKLCSADVVAKNLLCELDEDNCEQAKESTDATFPNTAAWMSSPIRDGDPSPPNMSMEKELSDVDKSMKDLSVESQNDDDEDSSPENVSIVKAAKPERKNESRSRVLADITNEAWASPATTRIVPTSKKGVVAFRSYNSSINASHLSEPSRVSVGSMDKIHFSLGCTGSYPLALTPAQKDRTLKSLQVGNLPPWCILK